MSSATDFAQLCRLCLVKEQVNVDIFEEPDNIRQIFHKISTCLPVKLSKEDKLPKRICEGCLYKLNIAYQFWNTSVNAEKQLLQWLKQSTRKSEADFPEKVKEEIDVPGNEIENIEDFLETSLTDVNTGKSETCVENVPESSDDEPLAKRRRRLRAQTRAAPPKPAEVIVGKVELNETDGDDNSDDPDDPNYLPDGVDMSDDNEQPGPSGLGTSTSDIPEIKFITCTDFRSNPSKKQPADMIMKATPKKCSRCDKRFRTNLQYLLHQIVHNDRKEYRCDRCNYKAQPKAKRNFEIHVRDHEKRSTHKCAICNQSFPTETQANDHKFFHNGETPYKCEFCEKSFAFPEQLSTHRVIEHVHSALDHLCDFCGKKFSNITKLNLHRKTHTGEKPFLCSHCPKAFISKIRLQEHERVHTGERPYKCKYCGKGFTQRFPCTIHERHHAGEKNFVCNACNKAYASQSILSYHMKHCKGIVGKY